MRRLVAAEFESVPVGEEQFDKDRNRRVGFAADGDPVATERQIFCAELRNEEIRGEASTGAKLGAKLGAEHWSASASVWRSVQRRLKALGGYGVRLAESVRRVVADASAFGAGATLYRPEAAEPIFGADYWPGRRRPSNRRIAASLLLSPLATLAPTLLLALLVYFFSENDHATAWGMTVEAAAEFFQALYVPLLLGAALGGGALWALRLRSRRAFAFVGGALGGAAGAAVYLAHGELPAVVAIYACCAGAFSMLALRSSAGVRRID